MPLWWGERDTEKQTEKIPEGMEAVRDLLSDDRQQEKVQYKQKGGYPEDRIPSGIFPADPDDTVRNKSKSNTVRNTVAQGHEEAGEKCRDGFGEIVPSDVSKSRGHHDSHNHQRRSGGR